MKFEKGQRVSTLIGHGRVVYQRMAGPGFTEPEAVSVALDCRELYPRYKGTLFAAKDVLPALDKGDRVRVVRASGARAMVGEIVDVHNQMAQVRFDEGQTGVDIWNQHGGTWFYLSELKEIQ